MAQAIAGQISEKTFRFKVFNISKLTRVDSPTVIVQGVSWNVSVSKECSDEKQMLGISLYSAKKDKPLSWTHAASAVCKLLSFDLDRDPVEYYVPPFVFNSSGRACGTPSFISWDNLLRKKYVKNDQIELEIKITADVQDVNNRSQLKLESIDKSCDCGSLATFRLTVTKIEHLMAVRSTVFLLRNLPWYLSIVKDKMDIAVYLQCETISRDITCKRQISVVLKSSKEGVSSVGKTHIQSLPCATHLTLNKLISWEDLLNPEKGFVKDDSIELEVKVEIDEPKGPLPNELKGGKKRKRLECAICFEDIEGQELSSTSCGHLFCSTCIADELKKRQVCPSCGIRVTLKQLHRAFLPFTN